ncbi:MULTISPECIES: cytochrome c biogenesis CcdA family protein [Arsenicicoccus]|uniref:cytochrome c biogenesis CcdA family protein n=1 Tax=Arsenicicoccus TaxID=267408 RepID=UPI00257CFA7E|nr:MULTISPECIES: cytochrome c biogenesis protein CcdA [Arsenicicoccus]
MSAGIQDVVAAGPMLAAAAVAALAGLISFVSPCVLPVVPGYLSYVAGGPLLGQEGATRRRPVVVGTALFILGFAAVFVAYGALFGGLGAALQSAQPVLTRVLGVVVVIMGLVFAGWLPGTQRQLLPRLRPKSGLVGAPLMGVTFGLGWTPCLGPTLATVQTLAFTEASAGRGATLAGVYAAGLGVPFIAVGLGMRRALTMTTWARRHTRVIKQVGAVMLIGTGLLLATGVWDHIMRAMQSTISGYTTVL